MDDPSGERMLRAETARGRGESAAPMKRLAAIAFAFVAGATAFSPARADEVWQTLPLFPPMPKADVSGYAPVNHIQMYYAVYGRGEPLIMLHGGLGHSDVWGNQIPVFAQHFKVITADSRGHGRSTRSSQPYSYGLMATDVLALMDDLKIDKASIVGWSDGGIIGIDIAINHPERLNRLFAFGANTNAAGLRPDIDKSAVFTKYIAVAGEDYKRLSKTPDQYDVFVKQISEMWATQPNYKPEQLVKILVPVAIADGEHDEAIRQEHNVETAKAIPTAKLVILPGVSHFAFVQKPASFNQAVLDFLPAK
jgi:pimeloyl-ACP methyl ester carboxylesterase